jgi:hypothetical protein
MNPRTDRCGRWPRRPIARLLVGLGLVAALRTLALAEPEAGLTGTYTASSEKGTLTLFLVVDESGRLVGLLRGDSGGQMRLDGRADGPSAEGTITDGRSRGVFAVHLDGSRLGMAMAEMGRDGLIDPSRALRLTLHRVDTETAGAPASSSGPAGAAPGAVAPPASSPETAASPPGAASPEVGSAPSASAPPESATASPAAREWEARLRGQRLTQLSGYSSGGGGGGYTSERHFYLCSNGSFVSSGQSSVSVYVPGATGGSARRSEDAGRWRIVAEGDLVRLELQSRDGGAARYLLSRVDGKTFLNRTRTFVTPENSRCP